MPFTTTIADISISVSGWKQAEPTGLRESLRVFLSDSEPDVTILFHAGPIPGLSLRDGDRLFDTGSPWALYRSGGHHVILLTSPAAGPEPYGVALFDEDFRKGDVYGRIPDAELVAGGLLPGSLEFPLSEVLMVCLLAKGRGLMVHACGIDDGGRGYLFCGNSTHGKTTMARLWQDGVTVLNDDRIVLRWKDGRFWMYGTPWHGDLVAVSPGGVPVEKVFFLRHAETNVLVPRTGAAASSMLLARAFPPLWDAEGMRFTLDFCARLTAEVPCYELGFVPDRTVLDLVRCAESP